MRHACREVAEPGQAALPGQFVLVVLELGAHLGQCPGENTEFIVLFHDQRYRPFALGYPIRHSGQLGDRSGDAAGQCAADPGQDHGREKHGSTEE